MQENMEYAGAFRKSTWIALTAICMLCSGWQLVSELFPRIYFSQGIRTTRSCFNPPITLPRGETALGIHFLAWFHHPLRAFHICISIDPLPCKQTLVDIVTIIILGCEMLNFHWEVPWGGGGCKLPPYSTLKVVIGAWTTQNHTIDHNGNTTRTSSENISKKSFKGFFVVMLLMNIIIKAR
jgi:hypothetical protein